MTADGRPPPHLALQVCRSADIIRTDRRMSNDDPIRPLANGSYGATNMLGASSFRQASGRCWQRSSDRDIEGR